jgi:hypothetical protein
MINISIKQARIAVPISHNYEADEIDAVLTQAIKIASADDETTVSLRGRPSASCVADSETYGYFADLDLWTFLDGEAWVVLDRRDVPIHILELEQILDH